MELNFKLQRNEEEQLQRLFNKHHRKQNRKRIVEEMIVVRKATKQTLSDRKKYKELKNDETKSIEGSTEEDASATSLTEYDSAKNGIFRRSAEKLEYSIKKKAYSAESIVLYSYFSVLDFFAGLKARKLLCAALALLMLLGAGSYLAYDHFIGYDVTFNGYKIGVVKDLDVLELAFSNLNAKMSEWYHNDTVFFEQTISTKRVFVKNSEDYMSAEELEGTLYSCNLPVYAKGAVILINGVETLHTASVKDAQDAIEAIRTNTLTEDDDKYRSQEVISSSIEQKLTIETKNIEILSAKSVKDAVTYMMSLASNSKNEVANAGSGSSGQNENTSASEEQFARNMSNTSGTNGMMTALNFRRAEFAVGEAKSKPALQWTTIKRATYDKEIKFKTTYKDDSSLMLGSEKTLKSGVPGSAEVTAIITYVNGKEVKREIITEKVTKEPVAAVVARGSKMPPAQASSGRFIIPVSGRVSSFNNRRTGSHSGYRAIDIACPQGTSVRASDNGTVIETGTDGSYGKYIIVQHQGGFTTMYAHLSSHVAKRGDVVDQGDVIGKSGNTGNSTGPHLHLEVRYKGVRQDLRTYFPSVKEGQTVKAGQ